MVALQARRRSGLGWRSCGRMGGQRHLLGRDCLLGGCLDSRGGRRERLLYRSGCMATSSTSSRLHSWLCALRLPDLSRRDNRRGQRRLWHRLT